MVRPEGFGKDFLYAAGIRGSELVGIDIEDICLEDKAILIRGRKKRYVFFGWKAARCLKYYLKARRIPDSVSKSGKSAMIER